MPSHPSGLHSDGERRCQRFVRKWLAFKFRCGYFNWKEGIIRTCLSVSQKRILRGGNLMNKAKLLPIAASGIGVLVLGFLLFQHYSVWHVGQQRAPLVEGERLSLPETLADIRGDEISVGGMVLFVFFDADSPVCLHQAAIWNYIHNHGGYPFSVVGISRAEDTRIKSFINKSGVTYPVVRDRDRSLFRLFRIREVPRVVFVDHGVVGVVPTTTSPYLTIHEIEAYLGIGQRQ